LSAPIRHYTKPATKRSKQEEAELLLASELIRIGYLEGRPDKSTNAKWSSYARAGGDLFF